MSRKLEVVLPDELGQAIDKAVQSGGPTVDELVTEAVRGYIGRKTLDTLSCYGVERARKMGLDKLSEDEQMDYVHRVITNYRRIRSGEQAWPSGFGNHSGWLFDCLEEVLLCKDTSSSSEKSCC
jgi:hypothetical protein